MSVVKVISVWTCVFALVLLAARQPAHAQRRRTPAPGDRSPHSSATLISSVRHVQPGVPFTVALRLEMENGWHSYWKNPGDSGQPTSIEWVLPEGFAAGSFQWPYPHRIELGPLTSYGYSDEVLLLTTITPPEGLEPGSTVRLRGTAHWLICADICLPASANLHLTLPVRAGPPAPNARWQEAFAQARAKLPKTAEGWSLRASRSQGSYALKITPPNGQKSALEDAYFFAAEKGVIAHAAPQPVTQTDSGFLMAVQQSDYARSPADTLRGVLLLSGQSLGEPSKGASADTIRALVVEIPVRAAGEAGITAAGGASSMTLGWALLFAFVGGLLLNLMPCVFPVLSIKVLGFAKQAGEENASVRRHGAVFGAGVLVSFWMLAGMLLVLRAAGRQIGWGFQLQSPVFVALMVMLFFAIGLNLAGVFGFGASLMRWGGRAEDAASTSGYSGSFFSGVLATVVATPCTAPLMGAALGFAIALPAVEALLIFSVLGVGMAAPYVLLSMSPTLLDRLPRPGPWMETLRQALAFPMFAAAVWLAWVFGRQTGTGGMALLLLALLLLSMAAWILGRWRAGEIGPPKHRWTRVAAAIALAGAVALGLLGARRAPVSNASSSDASRWQPFSQEKVERLRAAGRPVFIDFTAAWCLTCQVNKRTTLGAPAVQQAFKEKNVALLRADWTSRDPEITRALRSYGRSGVPLYVLYKGNESGPMLLPQILTEDIVLDALEAIPSQASAQITKVRR